MQKNKAIEPFLLKSKITDSINIDSQEILECYICCQKYDHQVRIPMIACLSCVDIVCLKCLNDKCQIYRAKGMFNSCNKCPREMIPAQFKRCLRTLAFIEIYQKTKSKENYYRETCQTLKLQQKILTQNEKKHKIQLQRLDKIFSKILKQKQESSKNQQVQKLNKANSKNIQNIHALTVYIQKLQKAIKHDEIQRDKFMKQNQDLKISLSELRIVRQQEEKCYNNKTYQLLQQIWRLNQLLKRKQHKNKDKDNNKDKDKKKKKQGQEGRMVKKADSQLLNVVQQNKNRASVSLSSSLSLSPLRKTTRQLSENDKGQMEAQLLRKKTKKVAPNIVKNQEYEEDQ